jgi:ABC-2 type transport system permease protein
MKRIWRIFLACFRAELALVVEYRAAVYVWMLASSMPLLMMLVWRHLAEAGPIGGYDEALFARYFIIGFLVQQLLQVWVVWHFDEAIRTGVLAIRLLRPVDPYLQAVADNLAANGFRVPVTVGVTAAGLIGLGGWDGIRWPDLPLFLLALAGAWGVIFNMHYALALVGLWTERVKTLEPWTFLLLAACGGVLFPLDLLPVGVRGAIGLTPFPYIVGFPVSVLVREVPRDELMASLAMQALWIAVFVLSHRLLWRAGLRRFGAVGG